jgi:HSP20 family molecular chaperone IbpA
MKPEMKTEETGRGKHESATPHGTERIQSRKVYVPLVDILESEQALHLIADMPGVDDQGVDVTIEKNILTVAGKVSGEVPAGYQLTYEEYGVGDYERSFTLPNDINHDGIQATIKDGLLRLTLPKVKQAVARKVAVAAG